ncbi:hypothetical protein LEP1GSC079_3676 [Leptospira interrogans str. FPW1039]|uniref:Uncharacterized protein n=1 Tax=Leptospira interrogans str. FPW1039 TaxID=1193040 RepID=A0A0F6IK17_LEPIR|nr:hypothetical protein LEP1GSC079_3676 [Leptospira interrogans str. FPW1039]
MNVTTSTSGKIAKNIPTIRSRNGMILFPSMIQMEIGTVV